MPSKLVDFYMAITRPLNDNSYTQLRRFLQLGKLSQISKSTDLSDLILSMKLNRDSYNERLLWADRWRVRNLISLIDQNLLPSALLFTPDLEDYSIWRSLPDRFFVKHTNSSSFTKIFERDRYSYSDMISLQKYWNDLNYSSRYREWVYEGPTQGLLLEEVLPSELVRYDYKFFMAYGELIVLQVDMERFIDHKRNLYDHNLNLLPSLLHRYRCDYSYKLPEDINVALDVAKRVSKNMKFIRVDLYLNNSVVKFGELTNFPGGGFERFSNTRVDSALGERLLEIWGVKNEKTRY